MMYRLEIERKIEYLKNEAVTAERRRRNGGPYSQVEYANICRRQAAAYEKLLPKARGVKRDKNNYRQCSPLKLPALDVEIQRF